MHCNISAGSFRSALGDADAQRSLSVPITSPRCIESVLLQFQSIGHCVCWLLTETALQARQESLTCISELLEFPDTVSWKLRKMDPQLY